MVRSRAAVSHRPGGRPFARFGRLNVNRVPTIDEMYLDVGATSRDEVVDGLGVRVGDYGVYQRSFRRHGDRVHSNALDDRAGLAALTALLRRLVGVLPTGSVSLVASVQEEFSARALVPTVRRLAPDVLIAVDVSPATDTPEAHEHSDLALGADVFFVNGVPIERFAVVRERNEHEFGRRSARVFEWRHSVNDELRWLDSEGPLCPALIERVRSSRDEFDYVLFFNARYYQAYHGARAVPSRAVLVPTAERDAALGLEVLPENVVVIFTDVTEIPGAADAAGAPSLQFRSSGDGPAIVRGRRVEGGRPAMDAEQVLVLADGTTSSIPGAGRLRFTRSADHNHWHLKHAARYSLWNSDKTAEVAPALKVDAIVSFGGEQTSPQLFGITPEYFQVRNLNLSEGELITEEHMLGRSSVVLLGPEVAINLFGHSDGVSGETVRIEGQPFRVIGVLESKGGGAFGSEDNQVLVPFTTAQTRLIRRSTSNRVDIIFVQAVSGDVVQQATEEIAQILRTRHRTPVGEDDFTIFSQQDLLTTFQSITGILTVLVDGDDLDEPITDAARSVLDGHVVLSRKLAEKGHFPAVDVGASISRVFRDVTSPEHQAAAQKVRSILATYDEVADLIQIGAYQKGSVPQIDRAVELLPRAHQFLRQQAGTSSTWEETGRQMRQLADAWPW